MVPLVDWSIPIAVQLVPDGIPLLIIVQVLVVVDRRATPNAPQANAEFEPAAPTELIRELGSLRKHHAASSEVA